MSNPNKNWTWAKISKKTKNMAVQIQNERSVLEELK